MNSYVSHVSVDCLNAYELSEFWRKVLAYNENADDPNEPGAVECPIFGPYTGQTILFIQLDDPKPGKNRVHFDLRPREGTRDKEVERLQDLGARFIADRHDIHSPGTGWVTLADPEGNQFCFLRSDVEKSAAMQ